MSLARRARHRIAFARAQRQWFRRRGRDVESALRSPEVAGAMHRLPPRPATASEAPADPHVVVVPLEGRAFGSLRPGTRNFYYEAAQSLREMCDPSMVSVFDVDPGVPATRWHAGLIDHIHDARATHVLMHAECDPGTGEGTWSWDVPWTALSRHWDGVLLGVMFDSAYEWTEAKARRLARISERFVLVDICEPMDGALVRGRHEVGPVNMPLSLESLALVDERLEGVHPEHDVSFIGALYPYRVELIERLRALGIEVVVNPHRSDTTRDLASSRTDQPAWLDYMAGLASSRMTVNFSRSSAGPTEQLKTRVIEGMIAGTLVLTDDRDRTRRFWTPGRDYGYFADIDALPRVIQEWLANPDRRTAAARSGSTRARAMAPTAFWRSIDDMLALRGLPRVLPATSAP